MLSGRGESHLSGFHSPASAPQSSGEVFTALTAMKIPVLAGMKSSESVFPLTESGVPKGRMVSFRALLYISLMVNWWRVSAKDLRSQKLSKGRIPVRRTC